MPLRARIIRQVKTSDNSPRRVGYFSDSNSTDLSLRARIPRQLKFHLGNRKPPPLLPAFGIFRPKLRRFVTVCEDQLAKGNASETTNDYVPTYFSILSDSNSADLSVRDRISRELKTQQKIGTTPPLREPRSAFFLPALRRFITTG